MAALELTDPLGALVEAFGPQIHDTNVLALLRLGRGYRYAARRQGVTGIHRLKVNQLVNAWKMPRVSGADCAKPTLASRRAQAVLPTDQRTAPTATARAFRNLIA